MEDGIKVGDRVEWTQRRRIYRGFELVLREGTVVALEGDVAVIKPPKKHAKCYRVRVAGLKVKQLRGAVG